MQNTLHSSRVNFKYASWKDFLSDRSYVPANWLSTIRTSLQICSAHNSVPNAWCIQIQQENDKILMDVFESCKPSPNTLEKLNEVHLFLGASTLADICNEAGTQIEAWALIGIKQAKPMIPWPNQAKPLDKCWAVWIFFLKSVFAPSTPKPHRVTRQQKSILQLPTSKSPTSHSGQG
eukprot:15362817-Ditylum_brightwellii.AAC.1